jgi:PAP2 superfamily protein
MSIETLRRRTFPREAALVAVLILGYFSIRNTTAGSADVAFANAQTILDVERWAHVDWEDELQSSIARSDVLTMLVNWVYIWGHWPVILGAAAVLFFHRPDRYRFLRNAVVLSGALGFLFFALFPVAPPRMLDLGLTDTVTQQSHAYRTLQPPGLTNQYAAFPSLHVGWNVVVGIVLLTTTAHLAVRVFAIASPLAMGFAVVATANHFVVDVGAGLVVVLIGLGAAYAIERGLPEATLVPRGAAARHEAPRGRASPVPRRASRGQPPRRPQDRRDASRLARRS